MSENIKETIHDTFKSVYTRIFKHSSESKIINEGVLTPSEFVEAGDLLVYKYGNWSWASGDSTKQKQFLPKEKQFLKTTARRSLVMSNTHETTDVENGFSLICGDEVQLTYFSESSSSESDSVFNAVDLIDEVEDPASFAIAPNDDRIYDFTICYDEYYKVPTAWLCGYQASGKPLTLQKMLEDVSRTHVGQTVTYKKHPHLDVPYLSIHPCIQYDSSADMSDPYDF